MKIVAIVGPSQSGKTRLMTGLIQEFKKKSLSVAALKHCSHGFVLDVEGKDSWAYQKAGADGVGLAGPAETAVVQKSSGSEDFRVLAETYFRYADIVLIEGGKNIKGFKKVEVVRSDLSERPGLSPEELVAVVSRSPLESDRPVFLDSQTAALADFLLSALNEEIQRKDLFQQLFSKHDPRVLSVLRQSTVGIAGAGGLGSNVSISLARAGVGRLIIADFDDIEPSNLNRQQYFIEQIGRRKVDALVENLMRINPFSEYSVHDTRVTEDNTGRIFGEADILVEAFDKAEAKQKLIDAWLGLFPDKPIIAASGLAGYGKNRKLHTRKMGRLYICGDEESECPEGISPMAPRVALVANMQANLVVELLMKIRGDHV